MGVLKFVIPFIGGAITAAAVGVAMQIQDQIEEDKIDAEKKAELEVDAEFVEKTDDDN